MIIDLSNEISYVYAVLGIDEYENDRLIAMFGSYEKAKLYCIETGVEQDFYDLWIEKHVVN